jgi:hypothetical protein
MKKEYDFSKGRRGAIEKPLPGKTRITIRIDNEVLDWFRARVDNKGGGNYQTMINDILVDYIKREGNLSKIRCAVSSGKSCGRRADAFMACVNGFAIACKRPPTIGFPAAEIARHLGVNTSSVSRGITRMEGGAGEQ